MYQLYYYPGNASLAPHFILEELGVDFELILVDRKSNAQKSADYLQLNPAGRIPTLVDNDLVLFESPAICLYLAEQNPKANLIPNLGSKDRAIFYQWLMYLTNTLQAEQMLYFYPEKHTADKSCVNAIVESQDTRVIEILQLLDNALMGKSFLVGDQLTVCDYFLLMLLLWSEGFSVPALAFPNLKQYLCLLAQRDAVISVCKKENISLEKYS